MICGFTKATDFACFPLHVFKNKMPVVCERSRDVRKHQVSSRSAGCAPWSWPPPSTKSPDGAQIGRATAPESIRTHLVLVLTVFLLNERQEDAKAVRPIELAHQVAVDRHLGENHLCVKGGRPMAEGNGYTHLCHPQGARVVSPRLPHQPCGGSNGLRATRIQRPTIVVRTPACRSEAARCQRPTGTQGLLAVRGPGSRAQNSRDLLFGGVGPPVSAGGRFARRTSPLA